MSKKLYYIETTLNGYVIKKIPICEFIPRKDYCGELHFKDSEGEVEYYDKFSGSWDELDRFLKRGNHEDCKEYQEDNHLQTKSNVYLEYWYTDVLGYYRDRYIGITVE